MPIKRLPFETDEELEGFEKLNDPDTADRYMHDRAAKVVRKYINIISWDLFPVTYVSGEEPPYLHELQIAGVVNRKSKPLAEKRKLEHTYRLTIRGQKAVEELSSKK